MKAFRRLILSMLGYRAYHVQAKDGGYATVYASTPVPSSDCTITLVGN